MGHCLKSVRVIISPYLVRIRENTDQKNSEYGHFSHSVIYLIIPDFLTFSGGIDIEYWSETG